MQAETLTGLGLLDELPPDLVKSELMETLLGVAPLKLAWCYASPDLVKSELMETICQSIHRARHGTSTLPIWLNRN